MDGPGANTCTVATSWRGMACGVVDKLVLLLITKRFLDGGTERGFRK